MDFFFLPTGLARPESWLLAGVLSDMPLRAAGRIAGAGLEGRGEATRGPVRPYTARHCEHT